MSNDKFQIGQTWVSRSSEVWVLVGIDSESENPYQFRHSDSFLNMVRVAENGMVDPTGTSASSFDMIAPVQVYASSPDALTHGEITVTIATNAELIGKLIEELAEGKKVVAREWAKSIVGGGQDATDAFVALNKAKTANRLLRKKVALLGSVQKKLKIMRRTAQY